MSTSPKTGAASHDEHLAQNDSHGVQDCPAAKIARAYVELHWQTHGRPVAGCRLSPCGSLSNTELNP